MSSFKGKVVVSRGINPGYSWSPQSRNNIVKYCKFAIKYEIFGTAPSRLDDPQQVWL
jgi:hypothetical protein